MEGVGCRISGFGFRVRTRHLILHEATKQKSQVVTLALECPHPIGMDVCKGENTRWTVLAHNEAHTS